MSKLDDITLARIRAAIKDPPPANSEARRALVDWLLPLLYTAAPDKEAFRKDLDSHIAHALMVEARERPKH
jgi:hypothetical protein